MTSVTKEATVLDIRTHEEYCKGHICGAYNIETPLPPFTPSKIQNLFNKLNDLRLCYRKPIYVYCKKGIRAQKAKEILEYLGYHNVISLGGVNEGLLQNEINLGNVKLCKC